jgi:O-antigen/teichoic acid export membrane protein
MTTSMSTARRQALIVLIASITCHVGNYAFYLVAARLVTPAEFAAITALITFGTISMTPVNGVQMAVARDVALLRTSGTDGELSGYLRRVARRIGVASLAILVGLAALSPFLAHRLNLGSAYPVVIAALWIATIALLSVLNGVVQGMEKFGYVAFALAGPLGALRTVLLPLCLVVVGFSAVAGSMWAMVLATVVGLAVLVRPAARAVRVAPTASPAMPSTLLTMIALLAFSSLTNVDVLFAQASLAEADRAHYAAAVLLGKIALFAPSALAFVLLPQATAAVERGERAERPVLLTMAVTAAVGLAIALVLFVMPTSLLTATFGPAYAASKPLLAPLALVMTAAAVLLVHVTFATARHSKRMPPVLVIAAVAHWILLAFLHGSPTQVITASAIAVGATLVVIEVRSSSGIVRMFTSRRNAA